MPIGDMTGAAGNAIDAARMQGAVNAQRKGTLMDAGEMLAKTPGEVMAKKQLTDALVKNGLDPALGRDPHTAITAILAKQKDDLTRQRATTGLGEANAAMAPTKEHVEVPKLFPEDEDLSYDNEKTPDYAAALRGVSTPEGESAINERYKTMSEQQRSAALAQRPETDIERAKIAATSRENVAQTGAASREDVAKTRTGATDRRTEVMRLLGERKNELTGQGLDERAAEAQARQELGFARLDETTKHDRATEDIGQGNLDQRKAEFENHKAEFTQRLDRIDQRIELEKSAQGSKIDPKTMQRIVNARQRARDAAQMYDAKGAAAAMEEAEGLLSSDAPATGAGKLKGNEPPLTPEAARAKLLARHPEWNGKLPGEK